MLSRRAFLAGAPLALASCGAEPVWAPDARVDAVRYRHPGPAEISLYTVFNAGSDNGAHTGLLINASERVLFDPAGSFKHPKVVERNDVIYGVTDSLWSVYIDYHTRLRFYSRTQTLTVPDETAAFLLQAVVSNGAVAKANCTRATSTILSKAPGFSQIKTVWYPNKLYDQFAKIPGVQTREFTEDDDFDKSTFWNDHTL